MCSLTPLVDIFLAAGSIKATQTKYGRTYDEELVWDLDNHGTMVAGIIKEKGPYNVRFYNFKVGSCSEYY